MNTEVIEATGNAVRTMPEQSSNRAIAQATPSDLLRIAVEQGADIEKLEKLMALQERWEANQARKAYIESMAEFKKNAPDIYKDKDVSYTGTSYSHATLGGICEVVIEALAKCGFSHRWDTKQPQNGMITVTCILTHILGHSEGTTLEAPPDNSGKKNSIQSIASTVTYLQRYTLLAACGLATKDLPDDDGHGAGKKEEKPASRPPLNGKAFERALDSIKSGEYKAKEIENWYALTEDQKIAAMDAEKERK